MRVLWFACTPSCYDVKTMGGWIEALEKVVRNYLIDIQLAIVFEHNDDIFKVERNGVIYYPIRLEGTIKDKIISRFHHSPQKHYEKLRPKYLKAVNDFKPDLIQCFGTELWHYSLLQKELNIPFVIHIMGFWNIISLMENIHSGSKNVINPLAKYRQYKNLKISQEHLVMECESMKCCQYFMGRTEWDKNVVKYFSPNSIYFHCPEAIRDEIYLSDKKWVFKHSDVIKLITISNAGDLKGNEIMLHTAWILKYRFGKKIEWVYTTFESAMEKYEDKTGIKCSDVGIKPIGRLNSLELADALCSAQMFIHSSIIDNSPNSICEAQLIGIPVISTNSGGIPQIVEDGVTGFLYPYSEPYALAFKIMELHNNEKILNTISENERQISHHRHNPKLLAERLVTIYEQIINSKL